MGKLNITIETKYNRGDIVVTNTNFIGTIKDSLYDYDEKTVVYRLYGFDINSPDKIETIDFYEKDIDTVVDQKSFEDIMQVAKSLTTEV